MYFKIGRRRARQGEVRRTLRKGRRVERDRLRRGSGI
jgi:hypothetical protein